MPLRYLRSRDCIPYNAALDIGLCWPTRAQVLEPPCARSATSCQVAEASRAAALPRSMASVIQVSKLSDGASRYHSQRMLRALRARVHQIDHLIAWRTLSLGSKSRTTRVTHDAIFAPPFGMQREHGLVRAAGARCSCALVHEDADVQPRICDSTSDVARPDDIRYIVKGGNPQGARPEFGSTITHVSASSNILITRPPAEKHVCASAQHVRTGSKGYLD